MVKNLKDIKNLSLRNKILLGAGVVVVVAGWFIVKGLAGKTQAGGPRGGTVAVEIAPIVEGQIRDLGIFSGTVIPKSQFVVAPKVSGKLKKLYVDIGDRLTNRQLVAQLEDEEYQQQVIQAEADLNVAKANLEEARSSMELSRKELERAESLHQKGIYSDAQIDSARAQTSAQESKFKVTEAQLSNREAALEAARVRLSYTRIAATWEKGSGERFVGERFVDEGALLSPNSQIISVIELQPITTVIYATDKEYFRIQAGQEVAVMSTAFPSRTFAGRVTRIAPLLQETSRQARVEVDINNEGNLLKPGMFVNAEIEFARRDKARLVPFSSLVQRGGQQGLFLADLENKKAVFKAVTVGITQGDSAEVTEPADISGYAVILGQHLLQDGMNIILPDRAKGEVAGKPAGK
ncbi:MAG: efflux RND transporter periplasmic adaptor subunit [Candidatus Aminicenantes bacterium]|nr:efflux RND transporter periplasmic adaptor subunit [Candidatus Aminicenantes bacterium]